MEIEELKELIDSTINENGERAITGKALNLVLNELAVSAGSAPKRLYAGSDITDEQKESNAAAYAAIKAAMGSGDAVPEYYAVGDITQGDTALPAYVTTHSILDYSAALADTIIIGMYPTAMLKADGTCSLTLAI